MDSVYGNRVEKNDESISKTEGPIKVNTELDIIARSVNCTDKISEEYKSRNMQSGRIVKIDSIVLLLLFLPDLYGYMTGNSYIIDLIPIWMKTLLLIVLLPLHIILYKFEKRTQASYEAYCYWAARECLILNRQTLFGECSIGKVRLAYSEIQEVSLEEQLERKPWGPWILEHPILKITDKNGKCYSFHTLKNCNELKILIEEQIK